MHEDLGRVDYLFCDKTGTLTKNELVFNKWASGGQINPDRYLESTKADLSRENQLKDLLRCIVLCHDVLLINLNGSVEQKSGASQDELCLLDMVENKNMAKLVARDATSMTVEIMGQIEVYDIVKVNEFSSDRKMMSVVVRDRSTGQLRVFAKGASDALA